MVESGKFSKVQLIGAAALVVVAIVVGLGIRALRRDRDAAVETARIAKQAVPAQSSAGTSPVSLVEAVAEVNEVKPVVEAVPTQVEDANIAAVPAAEAKPAPEDKTEAIPEPAPEPDAEAPPLEEAPGDRPADE